MTRTTPHHDADDCVPDATDHMEALGYEGPVPLWDFPDDAGNPLDLLDSAIEFIEALLGADMSYAALPITDPQTRVEQVIAPHEWETTLADFKRRRDALRAGAPA